MAFPSLSVVIPAFNEAGVLPQWVGEIAVFLKSHVQRFELIVVDDGSRDGTAAILEELRSRFPEIRSIRHSVNRGYGASLQEGFSSCRFDWIFFTDADRQFQIENLLPLLPFRPETPVVVGFRKKRCDSMIRQFLSLGYNKFARLMFGLRVRDVNCAFKLIHSEVLKTFTLQSRRFFVNTELLIKIRQQGVLIRETAVNHRPRSLGRSKVGPWEIPRTLREMALFCLTHA